MGVLSPVFRGKKGGRLEYPSCICFFFFLMWIELKIIVMSKWHILGWRILPPFNISFLFPSFIPPADLGGTMYSIPPDRAWLVPSVYQKSCCAFSQPPLWLGGWPSSMTSKGKSAEGLSGTVFDLFINEDGPILLPTAFSLLWTWRVNHSYLVTMRQQSKKERPRVSLRNWPEYHWATQPTLATACFFHYVRKINPCFSDFQLGFTLE